MTNHANYEKTTCQSQPSDEQLLGGLHHLSLEITAGCNEKCVHCCVSASPKGFAQDKLARHDYERLLRDAHELGATSVQYIGGEPATKKHELMHLVRYARDIGYEHIEVYTNLTILPDAMLETFKECKVSIASSLYSSDERVHDGITQLRGSYDITTRNMQRVMEAKLPLRVGIIRMPQNEESIDSTVSYLKEMGIRVGVDRLRGVGRAKTDVTTSSLDELCHNCWKGSLVIAGDGKVYPCTIGRDFPVGNVLEKSLREILNGAPLREFRKASYQKYQERPAKRLSPDSKKISCSPCHPADPCQPDNKDCRPSCDPSVPQHSSTPKKSCSPCRPDDRCDPNECTPDDSDCYPGRCSPGWKNPCTPENDNDCTPYCNPQSS